MSLVNSVKHSNFPLNGISSYTTKSGSQVVIFEIIGSQNELLNMKSLRLTSDMDVLDKNGRRVNNFSIFSNTGGVTAGGVGGNGVNNIDINAYAGFSSLVQSIVIQDGLNNVLESVYNYPALLNTSTQLSLSQEDLGTWSACSWGVKNFGRQVQNQRAINSTAQMAQKFYLGLTQSYPLPFALLGQNKLKITLTLAPSPQVINGCNPTSKQIDSAITVDTSRDITSSYISMSNIKLIYNTIVLPDNVKLPKTGYSFRHFTTNQSTVNSSNQNTQYQPIATNAISVINNFIPSERLNNYKYDSVQSIKLRNETGGDETVAEIKETLFLKNSQRFPLIFPINERILVNNESFDAERAYYYISGINQYSYIDDIVIQPSTENFGSFEEATTPSFDRSVYGVGIRYDDLSSSMGTNFSNSNFGVRINSEVNGTKVNEMISHIYSTRRLVAGASAPVVIV